MLRHSKVCDTAMFAIGTALLGVLCICGLLYAFAPQVLRLLAWPCLFHLVTGYYCPGCGGTRAFRALLAGDLLQSLSYHPFVLYAAVVGGTYYVLYLTSLLLEWLGRGRIPMRKPRFYYGYFVIGILLYAVNFIWKNGALLLYGVALME